MVLHYPYYSVPFHLYWHIFFTNSSLYKNFQISVYILFYMVFSGLNLNTLGSNPHGTQWDFKLTCSEFVLPDSIERKKFKETFWSWLFYTFTILTKVREEATFMYFLIHKKFRQRNACETYPHLNMPKGLKILHEVIFHPLSTPPFFSGLQVCKQTS